ncbi:MAG: hypothetical protein IID44_14980 [Planctomycetes bacterium]|nr:hypothetical protein [Planctomycetota bacterium]
MNEHGDLAFRVRFEDRSEAVVLATSNIPEPSSFVLGMLGVVILIAGRDIQNSRREYQTRNEEVIR